MTYFHRLLKYNVFNSYKNQYIFKITHVTFMCPMRFNKFPLDEHVCKFMVGSINYDDTRMTFENEVLSYYPEQRNTILDYQVSVKDLDDKDKSLIYGDSGNYSLTGFQMTLTRNVAK